MKLTFRPKYIVYDKYGKNPVVSEHWGSGDPGVDLDIDRQFKRDELGITAVFQYYKSIHVVDKDSYMYDPENDLVIFKLIRRDGEKMTPEDRKAIEEMWNDAKTGAPVQLVKNVLVELDLILICDCA